MLTHYTLKELLEARNGSVVRTICCSYRGLAFSETHTGTHNHPSTHTWCIHIRSGKNRKNKQIFSKRAVQPIRKFQGSEVEFKGSPDPSVHVNYSVKNRNTPTLSLKNILNVKAVA